VRRVANQLLLMEPIDVLVHSADFLAIDRVEASDGIEATFATNVLSRVLLNHLLTSRLVAGSSIIHIAAAGMPGSLSLGDLPPPREVTSFSGHNIGQRANDVYGLALAVRQANARVFVFNPGMVDTDIRRRMSAGWLVRTLLKMIEAMVPTVSAQDFARRAMDVVFAPAAVSGLFSAKGKTLKAKGFRADPAFQSVLWAKAHQLVGVAAS
jgi:NAD(P)-dependent dehydrogenase (short-subunit alcohol dehydrogenase family)